MHDLGKVLDIELDAYGEEFKFSYRPLSTKEFRKIEKKHDVGSENKDETRYNEISEELKLYPPVKDATSEERAEIRELVRERRALEKKLKKVGEEKEKEEKRIEIFYRDVLKKMITSENKNVLIDKMLDIETGIMWINFLAQRYQDEMGKQSKG